MLQSGVQAGFFSWEEYLSEAGDPVRSSGGPSGEREGDRRWRFCVGRVTSPPGICTLATNVRQTVKHTLWFNAQADGEKLDQWLISTESKVPKNSGHVKK